MKTLTKREDMWSIDKEAIDDGQGGLHYLGFIMRRKG